MPMSPDAQLFGSLNAFSGGTVDHLRECWDGSAYNVATSEREALWYAYALRRAIDAALDWPSFLSLRELWPSATVDERYVFQSAIHTIHHNLPFSEEDQAILASEHNEDDYPFISTAITEHQPELVRRWQDWMWAEERGERHTQEQFIGESALLAEGCARLFKVTDEGHWKIVRRRESD
jgi:hypothetical protein